MVCAPSTNNTQEKNYRLGKLKLNVIDDEYPHYINRDKL